MDSKLLKNDNELLAPEPTTDLSPIDLEKVRAFREEGMPGVYNLEESQIARMMDLYLDGKPYSQISRITRISKTTIMFLSDKFNWFALRQDYLIELEANMRNRVIESKLVSQDFLLQLSHAWQKKIGKNITQFLATGDEKYANEIDLKEVDKYLKTIEILHKISSENAAGKNKTPAVGLNLGDGVTITKKDDNSVEITPKQNTVGALLKQYADSRRDEELKKESDIKKKDIK